MGAGQTFQWATQYPDFMDLAVPFCGAAKTSLHNKVMLEGVKVALLSGKSASSAGVCKGENLQHREWSDKEKEVGLKALGRVWVACNRAFVDCADAIQLCGMGLQPTVLPTEGVRDCADTRLQES